MSTHRVSISISDPWEFGEQEQWRPLAGELVRVEHDNGGRALIRLERSVQFGGIDRRYVIATPRAEGTRIAAIYDGKTVDCAIVGIPDVQAESETRFTTYTTRGGVAFIGGLTLVDE